jgi:hypothetical protein
MKTDETPGEYVTAEALEMTFEEMCKIEPELSYLREQALAKMSNYHDPNFWNYYEDIKRKLKQIVGWFDGKEYPDFFRTSDAYDVCHKAIYEGLT